MSAINAPVIFSFVVMGAPFVALWLVPFATLVRWTGLLFLAYALMKSLQWTYITFLATNNLNAYRRRDGRAVWALVTGASDGIGKAFAAELLRRGFNVIIVSRTEAKLKAVRDELLAALKPEQQGKVTAEYIVADAERALEAELYDHILRETKRIVGGGALTVVVNNVGIEVLTMGLLHEQNTQDMNRMLNVNCTFPTKLTALLLPVLIGTEADGKTLVRSGKGKGNKTAIINVSSYSSVVPAPFLSVYAATKSYNSAFSTNTALEYAPNGVDVLCITPSFVASAMTGTASTTIERCSARACAAGSLDKLGAAGWRVSPYWYHAVQEALSVHVYPTKLVETIVYALLKGNAKAHKRRRERQAAAAAEADAKLKAQ